MEEVNTQESWNKKKIFIATFLLILLIVGGFFLKTRILSDQSSRVEKTVKGVSSEKENVQPDIGTSIQEAVKEKINNLQQEVASLDVMEIASSSPQVQKILNDIKSLKQYPINQVQEICKKICGL
jgi:peptidoglycan hydrolase CwlO-like protein